LFAATREGLVLLDREAILHGDRHVVRRVFTERDGLPDGNVRSIDPEGDTLWIGTLFGLSEAFATAGDLRVERLFEPLTRHARRLPHGKPPMAAIRCATERLMQRARQLSSDACNTSSPAR
jgi:hypothetical protein